MIFDLFRITITTKGKYAAIEADAIPNLVNLLEDPESEVRLNALKVRRNQGKNRVSVESVSARVHLESWNESKKEE